MSVHPRSMILTPCSTMRLGTLRTSRSQSSGATSGASLATWGFKDICRHRHRHRRKRAFISIVQLASVPFIEVQNVSRWAVSISVVASCNAAKCARFNVLLYECIRGCLLTSPSPYIRR